MGKFILNGKEYGSSDIINASGVYMNPNDEIVALTSYTQSDQWEYTATKDCVVYIEINNAQGYGMNLLLDGKRISCIYANNVSIRSSSLVYLRTGQTLSLNASNYSGSLGTSYAVYGVIEGVDNIGHNYSTTEQVAGKWIDGKPVYEKTVVTDQIPNNELKNIPHNISNIDKVIQIYGTVHAYLTVDPNDTFNPIPRIQDANATNANMGISVDKTNIVLKGRSSSTNFSSLFDYAIIIIRYTKTTD